ncbi:MAG TPA: FG-GAP repeat protein, partial [Steroidobacteraceae bacterium]|nr:FG-GAP repeat protein [Steroidobacteraceae bacterium]
LASAYRGSLNSLVYVFELDANGKFFRRAKLQPLDPKPFDNFGRSLSMTDTTLVIGSPVDHQRASHFNIPTYDGTGAAYVFKRNSRGNWAQTQKLVPVEPAAGFGLSVAIDQGMIVVGAPGDDLETEFDTSDGHWAGGGAYVYLPTAGRYLQTYRLRPTIDQKFAFVEFGFQVAMSGPNIAVTAVEPYGFIDEFPRGFLFVYERDGSNLPLLRGIGDSLSSSSLALFNNLAMIGDPGDNRCIFGCPGSVTLYNVTQLAQ